MEQLERNLDSIKAEFFEKGKAHKGYDILMKHISSGKDEELAWLLRNHIGEDEHGRDKDVYGQELKDRFYVDATIEFYNLLLIASLAGHIPPLFNSKFNEDAEWILAHPSVKPYYEDYYPYKITAYTLKFVQKDKPFNQEANEATVRAFTDFVALNRFLKNDDDIEKFLGMLDHVTYTDNAGNHNIIHLGNTLSSYREVHKAVTARQTAGDKAVWGFIKFTTFISQFRALLQSIDEYPLLQSAIWLFHGYYLDRMNEEMRAFFGIAFRNLEKVLTEGETFTSIETEWGGKKEGETAEDGIDIQSMRMYAGRIIEEAERDVEYVLNPRWKLPLQQYFEN